jgi:hypothetical protein
MVAGEARGEHPAIVSERARWSWAGSLWVLPAFVAAVVCAIAMASTLGPIASLAPGVRIAIETATAPEVTDDEIERSAARVRE